MCDPRDGYPTPIASKLTGVLVTTLNAWDCRGFLKPSIRAAGGHGVARVYSFQDLIAIRVARELTQEGISPQALRKIVAYLATRTDLSLTDDVAPRSLVTDGHDLYEVAGDTPMSTLRRLGQRMILIVPLDEFVVELQAKIRLPRAA